MTGYGGIFLPVGRNSGLESAYTGVSCDCARCSALSAIGNSNPVVVGRHAEHSGVQVRDFCISRCLRDSAFSVASHSRGDVVAPWLLRQLRFCRRFYQQLSVLCCDNGGSVYHSQWEWFSPSYFHGVAVGCGFAFGGTVDWRKQAAEMAEARCGGKALIISGLQFTPNVI